MRWITEFTLPSTTAALAAIALILMRIGISFKLKVRGGQRNTRENWVTWILTALTIAITILQMSGEASNMRQLVSWTFFGLGISQIVLGFYYLRWLRWLSAFKDSPSERRARSGLYIFAGYMMILTAGKVMMGLGFGEVEGLVKEIGVRLNLFLPWLFVPVTMGALLILFLYGKQYVAEWFGKWRQKRKAAKEAKAAKKAEASNATPVAVANTEQPAQPPTGGTPRSVAHRQQQRRFVQKPVGNTPPPTTPGPNPPTQGGPTT